MFNQSTNKNMKTTFKILLSGGLLSVLLFSACSKSDSEPDTDGTGGGTLTKSKYVFVYTAGSSGVTGTYIISADDVSQGSVSSTNNGVETDAYSFIVQNNKVFAQAYTDQGPVTPFGLSADGKITNAGNVVTTFRTGVYGTVNDDAWIGGGDPRRNGVGELFRFDAKNLLLAGRSTTDLKAITQTGANAVWTGLFQVDSKIYMPYYKFTPPASATAPFTQGVYGSLDSTWIAVFSYPEMKYEKTIADDRTGYVGNWFSMQGLKQIENGDVYTWSTAPEINGIKSKKPSGIVRIKKGTEVFDKSYFFNMEEVAGAKIARGAYIANGKFLMALYAGATTGDIQGGRVKMAIVDVNAKSVTYVSGVPEHNQPLFKLNTYYEEDGKTIDYVFKDDNGQNYVYVINAETATAKKGLYLEGATDITSISKLKY